MAQIQPVPVQLQRVCLRPWGLSLRWVGEGLNEREKKQEKKLLNMDISVVIARGGRWGRAYRGVKADG